MDCISMHIIIDYHYLLQVFLFISFVALCYPISEIQQRHLLVYNRTILFSLPHKTRILFNPFGANHIFLLPLFVFELFTFKVCPDFGSTGISFKNDNLEKKIIYVLY